MQIRYFQKGFNYSQDGPGNRLVYHLQGCNLRCPWCSNPEGMGIASRETVVRSAEELANEAESCRPMMIEGGGVTLTGGEVLLQCDAATELFVRLHAVGINTAIESNLSLPGIGRLLPHTDHVFCDCKHYAPDALRSLGCDPDLYFENLAAVTHSHKHVTVRIPLIREFNGKEEDIDGFLTLFSRIGGDFSAELLPYHEYGRDKWRRLGLAYTVSDGFVTGAFTSLFENRLRAAGLDVVRT